MPPYALLLRMLVYPILEYEVIVRLESVENSSFKFPISIFNIDYPLTMLNKSTLSFGCSSSSFRYPFPCAIVLFHWPYKELHHYSLYILSAQSSFKRNFLSHERTKSVFIPQTILFNVFIRTVRVLETQEKFWGTMSFLEVGNFTQSLSINIFPLVPISLSIYNFVATDIVNRLPK